MKISNFKRVLLIILDGVGIGALPDADQYCDSDANTLMHVAEAVHGIDLPVLQQLGLGNICPVPGLVPVAKPQAAWGKMAELSPGKDTTTGHWELAGLPTTEPFNSYPTGFPAEIIKQFELKIGSKTLGNIAASGTDIIRDLGAEHLRSGFPIVYTSVDSVFQIAAHEEVILLERLYEICKIARQLLDPYRVGRVIARPFIGSSSADFQRTHRRHDFSMPPSGPTLLDLLVKAGLPVVGIGKISDIFAGQGITESIPITDNADGMRKCIKALGSQDAGLLFANLVDFDMLYGHRRDATGFAAALSRFDAWLPELQQAMQTDDLLLITADHGCDPVTPGSDHSREFVPILAWHKQMSVGQELGTRTSFCDVAATIAEVFGREWPVGESFVGSL